jgi:hypothetical protein
MALELKLIETVIVEAAKGRREPTEGPDKSDLPEDDVNDQAEACLSDKRKSVLGFPLHLRERIAHC